MREIEIIAVGKLKEEYLRNGENYFQKELSKKIAFRIITVADEKTKDGAGFKEVDRVKNKEGEKILNYIDSKAMVMAMDLGGREMKSSAFRELIHEALYDGVKIQIIIGGSLGISDEVLKKTNKRISFSKMTYPHQLFRIMLLEELSHALM